MIHVDYKEKLGYYYVPATEGGKRKVWLCGANCLKRAERYWSMDAVELDRIQDGEQEDEEID